MPGRPRGTFEILSDKTPLEVNLGRKFSLTRLARRFLLLATIRYRNAPQIIGINAFHAADIEAKFVRIGTASVMGINAADPAKEMFGDLPSELIFA